MRYSRQRNSVYEAVKGTNCHPSANWVYDVVKLNLPDISLGTVYRNLKELSESGEILTLETSLNSIHYDGDLSPHSHFICNECGSIFDLFETSNLSESLNKMGHRVEKEKSVFYGVCKDCINKH